VSDEKRAELWRLVGQWDESEGRADVQPAIIAALAAWPRTRAGNPRSLWKDGEELWHDLQRCAAGIVHRTELPPAEDDDIPF